ncbi:oxygen-independent coproporphyrinogen-3 oxidase [Balneicella halophila]|uniref:Heme chaperone HemW n=1 Tax=Balneicella halophila TaxID=1537566 RepID=A0A7L4USR6_BALHA|nr:radical SAM family heme chaperone HemW [Balneicella halophila]PVX52054.1 oxygen-independent coproporphyrinogen-3 oxidase [Balneicella halophila]
MAGIYLHIPFCRKVCGYCDFFKNASLKHKEPLLKAMKKEIFLRKNYLNEPIETIYFGGGTPSILKIAEVENLLQTIYDNFEISKNIELTFEANPDDLSKEYLQGLKNIGVNRLSIGIQSFDDKVLEFMNRRHTAEEAIRCVKNAKQAGFDNLSLDIIYGIPNSDVEYLKENLRQLCELQPTHISAYHLTIEQGTPFGHLKKKGKLHEIADENSEKQYLFLVEYLQKQCYEQYEISNFCKSGKISQHNTNYWMQKPYLGIGPSAHSYNKEMRQWNISNLKKYITGIEKEDLPAESEELSVKDKFNDYIMVRLRTKWGIDLEYVQKTFGNFYLENVKKVLKENKEDFVLKNTTLLLKPERFLRSDYLIAKFFVI